MNDFSNTSPFYLFKDTIAQRLPHGPYGKNNLREEEGTGEENSLDEFASYLASEAWPTLPQGIQKATYETKESVPETDTIPLESVSAAFVDTLVSYDIVSDREDALIFLRKVLEYYVVETCSPPPVWSSTRADECAICFRDVPLTYHHLIPRSTHEKVLKKGWHPKSMLNSVAWLCRPCHTVVHRIAENEDLARDFYTVDLLLERDDIQKWQKYAAKQRYGVRRG